MANSYTNPKFHGMGDNPVVDVNVEHVIPLGSKISTIGINDGPIIDAFNIDWTTGDYSYDSSGHIIESTGQLIEELKGKASTTRLENLESTVNSLQTRSADYYEQRWRVAEKTATVNTPNNNEISLDVEHDDWKLSPQYSAGKNTWMTARKVIYDPNNNYTKKYDPNSTWSTPMKMTGDDGIAYPVQPVLKYYWHTDYSTAPSYNASEQNPNVNGETVWAESPGNPYDSYIYLWMIQGQRQQGHMIDLDDTENISYWTTPVCLSGKTGEPGADGSDIEFIYKRYDTAHDFTNDNPSNWYTTASVTKPIEEWSGQDENHSFAYVNGYIGPDGSGWTDHPQGVTSSLKYEYATYRRTRKQNGNSYWEAFNTPFAWSVYGENGLDGDGVEYIYTTTIDDTQPTAPSITSSNYDDSQQSEWGVGQPNGININDTVWHDDPQSVDGTNPTQKFQWVSTRKYRYPKTNETALGEHTLDPNKKYWFNYSTPELWNWYVNDGTNADRIVMLYKRTNSSTTVPSKPSRYYESGTIGTYVNVGGSAGWVESPGNDTDLSGDEYLWMSSNYYSEKWTEGHASAGVGPASIEYPIYKTTDEWSTPVCLTGESGHDGEDGADIEFIYFRTSDDNKTFDDDWDHFGGDSSENDWPFNTINGNEIDEIKYYDPEGDFDEASSSDELHDVWTDNPLGITSTYDYEYAAVRRKPAGNDSPWGDFCKPFLWSKYGEDGVDGDGVEYIFYRSSDENEVIFDSSNNPPAFNLNTSGTGAFQKSEVLGNSWTDDPQGVDENNVWEYVSVRKFREITDSNKTEISSSFTGNSYTIDNITVHVGDKIWFPYSAPALWSKYAFDAVASNLTIETDNDMMAVAIDGQNTTRSVSSNSAQIFLYHNLLLLSSDKYNVSIISSNCNQNWLTITNTDNKWKVTIDIPADTSLPQDGSFNFQIMATVSNDTSIPEEIRGAERLYTFKVIGLSLSTIYQLKTDKIVIHRDVNNELENVNVTMFNISDINDAFTTGDTLPENFYIFAKPTRVSKSPDVIFEQNYDDSEYGDVQFLKNGDSFNIKLYTATDTSQKILKSVEFNLVYTTDAEDKQRIIDSFNSSSGTGGVIQPQYGGARLITHGILVDRETVSVVSDGAKGNPGTDSKSQEYIYFVTDNISYFENDNHANINPNNWNTHENVNINGVSYYAYLTDDFPFVNGQTSYMGWEDTQIGISEALPYQFTSTRTFDTSTGEWGAFSRPVCTHNWGHSGEDGDGVEYIYYKTTTVNKTFTGDENPKNWTGDSDFQTTEYIRESQTEDWKDNPQGVSQANEYEYISIRKYKQYDKLSQNITSINKSGDNTSFNKWVKNKLNENDREGFGLSGPTTLTGGPGFISLRSDYSSATWYTNYPDIKQLTDELYNFALIYNTINDAENGNNLQEILQRKYWMPYSEPTLWSSNVPGDDGNDAYVIDWTNDQINLAVDENGYIIGGENGQFKETSININSLNGVFGNNPTISMTFATTGTELPSKNFVMPWKFFTKNYTTSSENNVKVYVEVINYNTTTALNSSNIYCLQGDNSTSLRIIVGKNYPAANASDKAYIPTEGLELYVKVLISGNDKSTTQYKVLRVCGQHIAQDGQDGQNAVTYEIVPSANAIYRNNSLYTPTQISYVVNKYDGTSVSTVSTFSDSFYAIWKPEGGSDSASVGTSVLDISTSSDIGISNISYINLELMSNNIVIDRETIPIIDKGEKGSQGFTGPVVRYCGEWKASNNNGPSKYYNGLVKANVESVPNVYYKDIVYHDGQYYTPKSSTTYDTTGEFTNIGYVLNSTSWTSSWVSDNWTSATQFDFVATKLLYADQALVNQLSTHDLIATDSTGKPVAGITSGAERMVDKDGNEIKPYLNSSSSAGYQNVSNTGNDPVRIFAGEINKNSNYSLTNAPFRVTQSGVAYMENAVVKGDVTANSLKLQQTTSNYNGSFTYYDSQTSELYLPKLKENTTQMYFVLSRNGNSNNYNIKLPYYSPTKDRFQYSENSKITTKTIRTFVPEKNTLYQLIGTYVSTETYPTWSVIETPLAPIDSGGTEYKYIDITDDVQLIGYKYLSDSEQIILSSIDNIDDIAGPLLTNNNTNNSIDIEFFTYLDPTLYGGDSNNPIALADFGEFIWVNVTT